jgi:hypothetical protein
MTAPKIYTAKHIARSCDIRIKWCRQLIRRSKFRRRPGHYYEFDEREAREVSKYIKRCIDNARAKGGRS